MLDVVELLKAGCKITRHELTSEYELLTVYRDPWLHSKTCGKYIVTYCLKYNDDEIEEVFDDALDAAVKFLEVLAEAND